MLGLQIYTVRDKMTDEESTLRAMKEIKEIGYECVQLAGGLDTIRLAAEAAVKVGLAVVGILTSIETCKKSGDELLSIAESAGATDIGISQYFMTEENEAKELVKDACDFSARAAKMGISFSYHNHSNEFIRMSDGRTLMQLLTEGFYPAGIDLMPDIYWLQHGGVDSREFLSCAAGRVKILHLKDMKRAKDGPTFAALGEGNMNIAGIVEVAKRIGVRHYIVEQDVCDGDSMECARRSYNYIKAIL
ncbi:MAG: sugar phosphate isomerase/epimerase [Clostridia bacterium]|nr:sugar phosphate isomerase/epimerase [Clostridia bacterium]